MDDLSDRLPLGQVHLRALPVAGLSATDIDALAEDLLAGTTVRSAAEPTAPDPESGR